MTHLGPVGEAGAPDARVAVAMLARSPRAEGKTRLTAGLAVDHARALREALLLDAIEAALIPGWPVRLFVDPAEDVDVVRDALRRDPALEAQRHRCACVGQTAGDLGARMSDAMARTLATGVEVVVLVGSDAPDLPPDRLREAAEAASACRAGDQLDLVLGPAADGGFYLVAARHAEAEAFDGVTWSRPTVLTDVTTRAERAGRRVVLVGPWHDVDTPDDLLALSSRVGGASRTRVWVGRMLSPYNRAR